MDCGDDVMPVLKSYIEVGDDNCEVMLYEDARPVFVDVTLNNCQPLRFSITEATVMREALSRALEMFIQVVEDSETVH